MSQGPLLRETRAPAQGFRLPDEDKAYDYNHEVGCGTQIGFTVSLGFRAYMGVYIGTIGLCRGFIGIMEKEMETTIQDLGFEGLGFRALGLRGLEFMVVGFRG